MVHVSEIDETRARFMQAIASDLLVDVSRLMFSPILEASLDNSCRAYLPFGILVTDFLAQHLIVPEPDETRIPTGKAISRHTLRLSNAHVEVAPLPSQLQSHAVELDPLDEEVPPPASTDVPSSSTAAAATITSDPTIIDAIVALFSHMVVIHKDLVERIGQVYERVDLIVECQEHDIKAIRDTLSALSRRHIEFITEVNDFINNSSSMI